MSDLKRNYKYEINIILAWCIMKLQNQMYSIFKGERYEKDHFTFGCFYSNTVFINYNSRKHCLRGTKL